jgi:two-component system OmpR family sensor kinase
MRRRLILAVTGLVAAALIASGAGSLVVTRNSTRDESVKQITDTANRVASVVFSRDVESRNPTTRKALLRVISQTIRLQGAALVRIRPDGSLAGNLPPGVSASDLDVGQLASGYTVSGSEGNVAFAAAPIDLTPARLRPTLGVVVLTRQIDYLGPSWVYFVLVGGVILALSTLVAWRIGRRISRPLVAAADATARIASGDLGSRVRVGPHDYPEVVSLARAIDTMAEDLARARRLERQFLMSVSHDLRTPLTSIRGFGEAIADGAAADTRRAGEVIANESRRLERLVADLLELASLDARRFSLDMRSVEASEVLVDTAEGFRPMLEKAGLALEVQADSDDLWVNADPDRLAQVIANLVENAFNFAQRRIQVSAQRISGSVVLSVKDDGPGIDPEDLGRIFERLYQSYRSPARRAGSGLGLAIVSELVSAMGGRVSAQSPAGPEGGTRMLVLLDGCVAPAPAAS